MGDISGKDPTKPHFFSANNQKDIIKAKLPKFEIMDAKEVD